LEEAGRYFKAQYALKDILGPIDGVRGTWSWMFTQGNHGYALAPFIVDLEWWDQVHRCHTLTKGQPEVLPAFVEWQVPAGNVYDHYGVDVPIAEITDGTYPLSEQLELECTYHFASYNFIIDEECFEASNAEFMLPTLPLWALTPIDEDTYKKWSQAFQPKYNELDDYVISSIQADGYGYHGEYINPSTFTPEQCEGYEYEGTGNCDCGLAGAQHEQENLIYERKLWVIPDDDFLPVWNWTVSRWAQGWNAIRHASNNKKEDPFCLSSLVSSHSPYSRTLDSDDLTQEIARLSSIPLTSSQPWQESSTEPSPQLTLFDM
jgi:hypothetical protein